MCQVITLPPWPNPTQIYGVSQLGSKLTHYATSVYCAPLTLIPGISQIRSSPILGQSCLQPNAMKPVINVP